MTDFSLEPGSVNVLWPDISDWQEPKTWAVGLHRNPPDHSADNSLLITAVAVRLKLLKPLAGHMVVSQYEGPPGAFHRYPGVPEWCSWDDHVAVYSVFPEYRQRIQCYMIVHNYRMPDGNSLLHCIFLVGLVTFRPLAALALLWNLFEAKAETSGKQLIWLALPALSETFYLRPFLWLWKTVQNWRYSDGPKGMIAIWYQDPDHPFHAAAPTKFT